MSLVTEIITQDQIQDLWGCGFTIVARRRHPDPFFVPQDMVPQGRSYQWWHLVHDKFFFAGHSNAGWAPVPASRHDGYFMPFGHVGDIEVNGLGLFEKSKFEVDQERAQQAVDAQKPLQDWANNVASLGFEGVATIFDGGGRVVEKYDNETRISTIMPKTMENRQSKTIESTVQIPKDMVEHMAAVFAERDRLCSDVVREDRSLRPSAVTEKFYAAVDADKSLPWWPTLHAILLLIAIENVRKSLKQESTS